MTQSVEILIRKAVSERDARTAGRVADFLRNKGLNYQQILSLVQGVTPIDPRAWEALLYAADMSN